MGYNKLYNKAYPVKTNIIDCLHINNVKNYDAREIVNELGKHFSNIGKLFTGQMKKSTQPISFYNAKIIDCDKTMFLTPTNEHEISNLISNLKGKNTSGHDNISNCVIKDLKSCLLVPLTIIFNKSLTEGSFPSIMKAADVVPLHNSKSKLDKGNYRPISLLMTFSKLLEKIVYSCTYQFMEKTKQIYDGQFGFRRKHSCENAVQNLLSDIRKNEGRNQITIAAFLTYRRLLILYLTLSYLPNSQNMVSKERAWIGSKATCQIEP